MSGHLAVGDTLTATSAAPPVDTRAIGRLGLRYRMARGGWRMAVKDHGSVPAGEPGWPLIVSVVMAGSVAR